MARLVGAVLGHAALIVSYGLLDDEIIALQARSLQGHTNFIVDEDDFGEETEEVAPPAHEAATDDGAMLQARTFAKGNIELIDADEDSTIEEDPNNGAALYEGSEQKMEVKDDAAMLQASRNEATGVQINDIGEALHDTVWPTAAMLQAQYHAAGSITMEQTREFEDGTGHQSTAKERPKSAEQHGRQQKDDRRTLLQAESSASGRIHLDDDNHETIVFEDRELGVLGIARERMADDTENPSPEADDAAMLQAKRTIQMHDDDIDANLVFEDASVVSQKPVAETRQQIHLHQTGGIKHQVKEEVAKALVNQFTPVLSSLARAMDVWPS